MPSCARSGTGRALIALVVAVGLCVASGAAAEPDREVVAGALRNWPPHYAERPEGTAGGFAIDVMDAVARRANLEVRYLLFDTFTEVTAALADGRIDVIPNYGITEDRRAHVAFTSPVETFSIALFVRSDASGLHRIDDLRGRRVAVVASNAAVDLLEDRGIETVLYPDVPPALFHLLAGEVDAMAYPSSVLWAHARQAEVADRLRELGPPLAEIKRAIAVRAGDDELLAALSAAVQDLVGTSEYRHIYQRWHGHPPPYWTVGRVLWAAGLFLTLVLVVVAVWRFRVLRAHNRELLARIAERDAVKVELESSEIKYRQIVELANEGVWMIDTDGNTTFANDRMAEMIGLTPDDMLGRPMFDFFDAELATLARDNLDRRREGIAEHHDFRLRHADGSTVEVLMATSPITEKGEFRGALAMVADVTDRRRLEDQLQRSQKLEALGRLAGGVAHDFNNLLVIISSALALVRRSFPGGHPAQREMTDIEQACERARALTSQLLAFSRGQVTRPRVLRPATRIQDSRALLHRLLGEKVELRLPSPDPTAITEIDPAQLDQLVFNLVANARDAMPDGGRLDITVERRAAPDDSELRAGEYVVLSFRDTGLGIPEDLLPGLFEPFFTTKPEGQGTGLGLATCYGIARQAGGTIEVTSRPGDGSRFDVWLPLASAPVDNADAAASEPSRDQRAQTILLVEDESMVRRLIQRVLTDSDHVVLAAADADEALAIIREQKPSLDLLLTDIVMPGMNGRELARRIRDLMPDLRVVYMSGYTDSALSDVSELSANESFLAKPFTPADLMRAIAADEPAPLRRSGS